MRAFWSKTNHPLHTLNTAGVTRGHCRSWRCSSRWGPSLHEGLHVALGSRALKGSDGTDGNSAVLTQFFILNSLLSSTPKLLLILQQIDNDTRNYSDCIVLRGWILNYKAEASLITTYEHRAYAAILQETVLKRSIMLCHQAPKRQKSHSHEYQTLHL